MLILNVPILFIYFLKLTQQQAASCEWGLVTYTTIAIAITHNSGESSNLVGKTQKFQKTFAANFELQEDLFGCDTPLLTPTPIPPTTNQVIPPFPLISPPPPLGTDATRPYIDMDLPLPPGGDGLVQVPTLSV